jgi:hypothetical protein
VAHHLLTAARALGHLGLWAAGLARVAAAAPAGTGRPRVAFQAYALHLVQFQEPVIRRLLRDGLVEVYFVVTPHPQLPARERAQLRDLAVRRFGLPRSHVAPYWKTLWWKLDLVVSMDVLVALPLRRTRACLMAHGAGFSHREFTAHWLRRRAIDFDLVLTAGCYDADVVEKARREDGGSHAVVEVIGCPLLDRLFTSEGSRTQYLRGLGLPEDRPVVLYAPHWTDLNVWGADGPKRVREMIAAMASLPVNLIVKLHAMAYFPPAVGGRRWKDELRGAESETVRLDPGTEDVAALRYADVLITGVSSRAFNFMLLDKPVVLFAIPQTSGDTVKRRRLEALRAACAEAADVPGVVAEVQAALANPHARSDARRRQARVLFANPGNATDAAVRSLYRELGIDDPQSDRRTREAWPENEEST